MAMLRMGFEKATATHYCKYCAYWSNPNKTNNGTLFCPQCGYDNYLILNPFPDNLIPYVELGLQDVADAMNGQ